MNARQGGVGQLAYITGASSGIGQALAQRFYRAGWRLALVARRSEEVVRWATAQQLAADRCSVHAADVRDVDSIVAAGQACLAQQGLPDVVIANAGISIGMETAIRADLEVMRATFETNNLGMAATFHPFVQAMCDRRAGTLVGIGSVAGIRGLPGHGAYCASKAAVTSYCESLRGECRPHGVKVVTLAPGYIDTPLTKRNPYSMPFLMAPEDFADRAFEAIERGVSYRVIPWQMAVIGKLMRMLPDALFDRAVAGRARKPRQAG
ncbi:SDR family oxidoreductase [Aquincola sp. MAHUQ-54]|uniref:SDR family oxidoreductase n=1 Tax=Aquincola agrisoli TaxID=3119538 RepID=A0AAW9QQD7_9BURK